MNRIKECWTLDTYSYFSMSCHATNSKRLILITWPIWTRTANINKDRKGSHKETPKQSEFRMAFHLDEEFLTIFFSFCFGQMRHTRLNRRKMKFKRKICAHLLMGDYYRCWRKLLLNEFKHHCSRVIQRIKLIECRYLFDNVVFLWGFICPISCC